MGTNKAWKHFERVTARFFGGRRIVPSDTHTQGDVLNPEFYIECKCYLAKSTLPPIVKLFNVVERQAELQRIPPMVILRQKDRVDGLVMVFAAEDLVTVRYGFVWVHEYQVIKSKPMIMTLFEKTEKRAISEGKIPLVCLKRKGTEGRFLVCVRVSDFDRVVSIWKGESVNGS